MAEEYISGARYIVRALENRDTRIVAGVPGGAALPLYDALSRSRIRHILARHEQGAGFIAQGIARVEGRAGVCLSSSGPGVTNLLTAVADAKMDSVPLVAITAQVASPLIGTDAFQETDTVGLSLPITKHCYQVLDVRELPAVMEEAFLIAESGRPGPVVIDVPRDVLSAPIAPDDLDRLGLDEERRARAVLGPRYGCVDDFDEKIAAIVELIRNSRRPVLYVGGGLNSHRGARALIRLATEQNIPVTTTLMGIGAFPGDHPLALGMLGMHAAPYTNLVLEETDLLLAVGARFDDRATGRVSEFCPRAKIVHVDIDPAEHGKIKRPDVALAADAAQALEEIHARAKSSPRADWTSRVNELRREHPFDPGPPDSGRGWHEILSAVAENTNPDAIWTTDVGQHQMWTAQMNIFKRPRSLLTSGGLGAMGFGLPAAIGAALAEPRRRVVCITGDGSILMNIQELAVLAEHNLNVLVIVLNNGHLGLVRQQQELFYEGNFFASELRTGGTNFAALARAFGIDGIDLGDAHNPARALRSALRENSGRGPVLIDVPIAADEKVFPMVPPGAANRDMLLARGRQSLAPSLKRRRP